MAELESFVTVRVTWTDAHAGPEQWASLDELEQGEFLVGSVGYLIPVSAGGKEGHVTIAQSLTQDGHIDHVLYVPVGMVKHLVALDPPEQ